MAHNLKMSTYSLNAEADALGALADGGWLRMYNGAQPTNADSALSGQVLLAELRFATPAFAPAVGGVLTANAISAENDAPGTGTATWYRVFKLDGTTVLWDGSIGTSDADILMVTTSIVQHAIVTLDALTHTVK